VPPKIYRALIVGGMICSKECGITLPKLYCIGCGTAGATKENAVFDDDPGNEKVIAWDSGAPIIENATTITAIPLPRRTFFVNTINVVCKVITW
jgi:hypothetical protein